jgi:cell division protein ZapA
MAEKNETVNMNVTIAERSYPLKVLKSEEEKISKAAKLVNERISEYRQNFKGNDKQDYLAMCLLNFAVENLNTQSEKQQSYRSIEDKISELEQMLSTS